MRLLILILSFCFSLGGGEGDDGDVQPLYENLNLEADDDEAGDGEKTERASAPNLCLHLVCLGADVDGGDIGARRPFVVPLDHGSCSFRLVSAMSFAREVLLRIAHEIDKERKRNEGLTPLEILQRKQTHLVRAPI